MSHLEKAVSKTEIATFCVDIAKLVFQVDAAAANGKVLLRKRVRGAQMLEFFSQVPSCLVGLKTCPTAMTCMDLVRGTRQGQWTYVRRRQTGDMRAPDQ